MMIWILLTVALAVVVAGVTVLLVRLYDRRRGAETGIGDLKHQLADIDRRAVMESLTVEAAEALRSQAVRRFLAPSEPAPSPKGRALDPRFVVGLALGLSALVAVVAALVDTGVSRSDLADAGSAASQTPSSAPAGDVLDRSASQSTVGPGGAAAHAGDMIASLEARVSHNAQDAQAWRMLGWSYSQTGRFEQSATAYEHAAALNPRDADALSSKGEALTKAAGGKVTPQARSAFAAALAADPADARARYFLAAAKYQAGDHAGALADWNALLRSAPPGAAWAAEVRAFVQRLEASQSDQASPAAGGAPPTPSADQQAAAAQLSPAERQKMIQAMVDRLAERLKADPRDVNGWVTLMRSRMALGDPAAATKALRDAQRAFAGDSANLAALADAARQMGVPAA